MSCQPRALAVALQALRDSPLIIARAQAWLLERPRTFWVALVAAGVVVGSSALSSPVSPVEPPVAPVVGASVPALVAVLVEPPLESSLPPPPSPLQAASTSPREQARSRLEVRIFVDPYRARARPGTTAAPRRT